VLKDTLFAMYILDRVLNKDLINALYKSICTKKVHTEKQIASIKFAILNLK